MEAVLSKAISQALAIIAKREAQELKSSHTAKAPRKAYQRTQYASLTPEEKEARKAYQRTRYANLTPEEKEARKAYQRAWYALLSPEKKAQFNAKQRARYHKRNTPEEKEARKAYQRAWYALLTPEQRTGAKKRHNKVDNKCDKSIVRKIKKRSQNE